jgi:hypothetical protein
MVLFSHLLPRGLLGPALSSAALGPRAGKFRTLEGGIRGGVSLGDGFPLFLEQGFYFPRSWPSGRGVRKLGLGRSEFASRTVRIYDSYNPLRQAGGENLPVR